MKEQRIEQKNEVIVETAEARAERIRAFSDRHNVSLTQAEWVVCPPEPRVPFKVFKSDSQ